MQNPVVVITGASSGIGEAISYIYAKRKNRLVLAARSMSQLKLVEDKCISYGASDVLVLATDVTEEVQCKFLMSQAIDKFARIDILILNAGISSHFKFSHTVDITVFQKLMNTNFFGYLNCTKYAWPFLKEVNGQIVVVSSISGEIGLPERTAYCASKFAVTGFFDALDMEQQCENGGNLVSITMVCPASVKTSMREHSIGSSKITTIPTDPSLDMRMPVSDCASLIVNAADRRLKKVFFPLKSSLAVYLRPLIPTLLNPVIRRYSKL